jgi:hypothetical protein
MRVDAGGAHGFQAVRAPIPFTESVPDGRLELPFSDVHLSIKRFDNVCGEKLSGSGLLQRPVERGPDRS